MWHVTKIYIVRAALARSRHHYFALPAIYLAVWKKRAPAMTSSPKNGVRQPTEAGD